MRQFFRAEEIGTHRNPATFPSASHACSTLVVDILSNRGSDRIRWETCSVVVRSAMTQVCLKWACSVRCGLKYLATPVPLSTSSAKIASRRLCSLSGSRATRWKIQPGRFARYTSASAALCVTMPSNSRSLARARSAPISLSFELKPGMVAVRGSPKPKFPIERSRPSRYLRSR